MSGFRHEFQLLKIRNLTTYTPNVDVLKACENAYILVEFIFRLVENSLRKRSQQTVVMPPKFKNYFQNFKILRLAAHVSSKRTHLKLSKLKTFYNRHRWKAY
jgi:hypothetical protein